MDCKQIQKLIGSFEKNELSLGEEEKFVKHIFDCKECQEELEIFYIIEYGLSDDHPIDNGSAEYNNLIRSYDFKGLVNKKLNNSKHKVIKIKKAQHYINIATLISEVCVLSAILLYFYTMI